jgi:hypothetical protein
MSAQLVRVNENVLRIAENLVEMRALDFADRTRGFAEMQNASSTPEHEEILCQIASYLGLMH